MRLAMNRAKMAHGGFWHAALDETQFLVQKTCTEFQEETKRDVEFPGHDEVKAAIERHPAMIRQNHTARLLPCQIGTGK